MFENQLIEPLQQTITPSLAEPGVHFPFKRPQPMAPCLDREIPGGQRPFSSLKATDERTLWTDACTRSKYPEGRALITHLHSGHR